MIIPRPIGWQSTPTSKVGADLGVGHLNQGGKATQLLFFGSFVLLTKNPSLSDDREGDSKMTEMWKSLL